jgi:hypothetical protein
MKQKLTLILFAIAFVISISSCATLRSGGGGCKATQGLIGYGPR